MASSIVPYTMHCPKCKVGIKIKKESMIGTRITCPKCKKRIDVVTPDEDGYIPYGVDAAPVKEPDPEPTEEEIEERELQKLKERRKKQMEQAKHWGTVLFYLLLLVGIYFTFNYFVIETMRRERENPQKAEEKDFRR